MEENQNKSILDAIRILSSHCKEPFILKMSIADHQQMSDAIKNHPEVTSEYVQDVGLKYDTSKVEGMKVPVHFEVISAEELALMYLNSNAHKDEGKNPIQVQKH